MSTATIRAAAATDEAAILALVSSLHQAHHDKSAAAIAAPFAPHAVIYDLEPRNFELTIDGDHAFGHGYLRLSGQKKGADHPISFWMRATMCFERINGTWRIVHEHTSVPFYMDGSLRPAFDLQP
jgi:ketosteroid isomerase-like protein